MAFEKGNAGQVVTWAPPLPQRAFPVVEAGSTTDLPASAGAGTGPDGTRYGWYTVSTSQWASVEGQHTPPVSAGEKFQLWKVNPASTYSAFPNPPVFAGDNVEPGAPAYQGLNEAPDLFSVYPFTITRETAGQPAPYLLQDPQLCTVIAVQQESPASWEVYFAPPPAHGELISAGQSGIITVPQPYSPRWLGRIGHVADLNYTYSLPGGPDQLTATLQVEPNFRTDAMNPGRVVTVHKGGSCIWEGILTEPVPASTGWTLTANGVGTYGTNFAAWWQPGAGPTKGSSGWTADAPVDLAIARGLRWVNRGIGSPPGIYLGPVQNPGSLTVTDFLNLLCTGGSLTWELVPPASASSFPPGPWELKIVALPQDFSGNPLQAGPVQKLETRVLVGHKWKRVDRLAVEPRVPPQLHIINTNPVQRSIVGDYNTIVVYYQATPDVVATATKKAVAATYRTTFADVPGSVALHGRMEYFIDISNGGVYSRGGAQAVAKNILNKYIRANFSAPFTVQPGQLVSDGGVPVDLGCNWGGHTTDVLGINYAFGGEVGFAPISFVIGEYEFSDNSQTATITPYQSARTDLASIISMLYPGKFA
jgi:hypothetical protein